MMDGIIKADGTSRLMRAELPATYEEFRAKCRDGAQPLDILFNALGWSQLPTFLNKANLLKDQTADMFGLGTDAVPDDVLATIKSLIDAASTNADKKAKIATGTYSGTGKYGSANKNSLTFGFVPKVVIIAEDKYFSNMVGYAIGSGVFVNGGTSGFTAVGYAHTTSGQSTVSVYGVVVTWNGNTVAWYNREDYYGQLNYSGATYHYIAIG